MTKGSLATSEQNHLHWHEDNIPLRGHKLSLEDIKEVYRELQEINRNFGEKLIAELPRNNEMTDKEWEAHKAFLLHDAFRLTVTIKGVGNKRLYGETEAIFDNTNLPKPVKYIYFTNVTAFQRNANGNSPENKLQVHLDFSKPDIADPFALVSAATQNDSGVTIEGDLAFFNSIQKTIEAKFTHLKTRYGAIHRNFVYDIGIWFLVIPASLYFSAYYMDRLIPADHEYELYRWPLFIYLNGCALVFYRVLTAYTKWAFPVNILKENKDGALRHRIVLGGVFTWLFYQFASTAYSIVVSSI